MKFLNKTHLKIQHVSFYSAETWAAASVLTNQTVFQNTCKIKFIFKEKLSVRTNKDSKRFFPNLPSSTVKDRINGFAMQKFLFVQGFQ